VRRCGYFFPLRLEDAFRFAGAFAALRRFAMIVKNLTID
jgi:hypothetical protein